MIMHHHHDHDENAAADMTINHHHHHADEVFTSWGRRQCKKYTKEEIGKILKTLSEDTAYGMILRAKVCLQAPMDMDLF